MKSIRIKILVVVALFAMAASISALADTITLSNPNQSGAAGSTFNFSGDYSGDPNNVFGSVLHWAGSSPNCDDGSCLQNDNSFFLSQGANSFFDIFVSLGVGPGLYTGT